MAEQGTQKHPGGRPLKFTTNEDLIEAFNNWKQEFLPDGLYEGEIPDIECFCDYVDSWRDLLNDYEKRDEFSHTIKKIKNWIYYQKKQLAMKGKMPVPIYIFDAINNTSYSNKTETDLTTDGQPLSFTVLRSEKDTTE